jgi:putative DNA primase/helicase
MKKSKAVPRVELSIEGVFITDGYGKKTRVAAPIRYDAVGTRIADNTKVALISFENLDGNQLSEEFNLSSFLPKNRFEIVERLANKGYCWPSANELIEPIFATLIADMPERRYKVVGAPGWYDEIYVTPDREYGSKHPKHRSFAIDRETGAKVAPFLRGPGSLKGWKRTVARVAKKSSPLRLCIAAGFAAPMLRPLGIDSFGLNPYGPNSSGKTLLLYAAASVSGGIGDGGLPGWADSPSAIEQFMIGYRDGLLPIDETADGEATMPLAKRARLLAFAIGRNRPRNLDKGYEKASNLTTRDCRNIVVSSSERDFGSIAIAGGTPRLGGEEVRLVDVPVTDANSQGIFDRLQTDKKGRARRKLAKRLVDQLRVDAEANQGFALHRYLRKYVKDPEAVDKLKRYMRDFERRASRSMQSNSDSRICTYFAAMYAAAALAIDYDILPWGNKPTFKAIYKCLRASLAARRGSVNPEAKVLAPESVALALKESLKDLDLVRIKKGEKATPEAAERRKRADGFRVGQEIYVNPKRWNGVTPANKAALVEQKILRTERPDVITMSRKVSGVPGKLRYIVINSVALDEAIARGA